MIRELRSKEITRDDVYDEYFRREIVNNNVADITKEAQKRMEDAKKLFENKKIIEVMIKGTVYFDKDFKKLFTFLDKNYNIEEGSCDEIVNVLHDLDNFQAFMNGTPINYFSKIENEYINYSRVLNAHVFIELH